MFNEIWGSKKKETDEGINDHDENLNDKKQKRDEEVEQETARIFAELERMSLEEESEKKEAALEFLQKSQELIKFIDENIKYLSLVSVFKREKFEKIEKLSKMTVERIAQKNSLEKILQALGGTEKLLEIHERLKNYGKQQFKKRTSELFKKIIEMKHFVEQKRDVLDLNPNFNEKDVNDILMLLELKEEEIVESHMFSDIGGLLMKVDMQLEGLKTMYNNTMNHILRQEGAISTIVGINFISNIQHFLKEIKNHKLREMYNDKYLLVLDAIFKEYSESRDRVVCREMIIDFYNEVSLLIQMQTSLANAKDIIDRYDKKAKNSQKLYLNGDNSIDVSIDKVHELLHKGDFDVLIHDGKTKSSQRIVQYPTIDKTGQQILATGRREEKKVIPSSYQLNPREFIDENAEFFRYILNSVYSNEFIVAMNSFIEKLKNNQIKDHSNNVIQTRDIGLELEKEFYMFMLVNLCKLDATYQLDVEHFVKNKMTVSAEVDLDMLFIMLAMRSNDTNQSYVQLIEQQISLMDVKQKNVFSMYLNLDKEDIDLKAKNTL